MKQTVFNRVCDAVQCCEVRTFASPCSLKPGTTGRYSRRLLCRHECCVLVVIILIIYKTRKIIDQVYDA
jgi:hypothetical protein